MSEQIPLRRPRLLQYHAGAHRTSVRMSSWFPLVDEPLRSSAIEAALTVAERMRDPEYVDNVARLAHTQTTFPVRWMPTSLSNGMVGIALLYGYVVRCFPKQDWHVVAQRYLSLMADSSKQAALSFPGMYSGIGGIALTLETLSNGGKRYQQTLASVQQGLSEQVRQRKWRREDGVRGVASSDYDVISGAAGLLAYLVSVEQLMPSQLEAIEVLLEYLIWLAEPDQKAGEERWYVSSAFLPTADYHRLYPEGYFNCGLAHGIPGPLAALALALLAGYDYPGLRESITYLSTWIIQHRASDQWGISWPDGISLQASRSAEDWSRLKTARTAWCYGGPGVARSIWLAGLAIEDADICQVAIDAIESALRRPIPARSIHSPTLCHGVAGLLQICLRFAHESESALVRQEVPRLVKQLLEAFNPDFPLGFRDLERELVWVDQPAWLTGAPGVAMALLAAATEAAPSWDRILALS